MTLGFCLKHEDKKPKGAVLMFHGLTGSPFELKKYGQFLYNNGFDVFADSLPGHGEKFDEIYTVTYEDWIDFAYTRFRELKSEYQDVFVSGLCLGAVLALQTAAEFKDEVKGVISLSTTLFLDGWRLPTFSFLIPLVLSTILRFYYNYPECDPHGVKNEKTRSVIKKLLEKGDVGMNDFPMSAIYELCKLSKFTRKNLHNVVSPILFVHSKEDDLTSVKSAKLAYGKVSSVDKELIILYDSYHMVLYDNEKERVYNLALEFLNTHLSPVEEKELVCI